MDKITPGTLISIKVEGLTVTEDGFATVSTTGKSFKIFEDINLKSYPSCNDFFGKTTVVHEGDVAIITKYVGRPDRITRDPAWFKYDVYEIYLPGGPRKIFRQNIEVLHNIM